MRKPFQRIVSALSALTITALSVPYLPVNAEIAEESKIIYATDFEDGDVSAFSPRGDRDTSVIAAASEDGNGIMSVTGRSKGWNGPQIKLDDICEAGVKYSISLKAKAAWYNDIKVSLQTTANGSTDASYSNLANATSQGDWVEFKDVKFSFSEDVHDVYLYVECNDGTDLSIDDFELKTAPVYNIQQDIPSLKDVYADYFKIGGAVTADELAPNSTKELIKKHYNSITLGNELKPENMLDQIACQEAAANGDNTQVAVSLKSSARVILDFCRDNDIPVRGHVLVWHSQTPGWFFKEDYTTEGEWVDQETMLARMENYIKNVMAVLAEEYPDVDFYAWDVINEAWLDDGSPRKGGMYDENPNYSGWVQVFGDNSFIPYAFEYARKYAPEGCKLYYNDFNEYIQGKRNKIVEMANELKEKGLIDGIGMQSHLAATNDPNNIENMFPTANVYKAALQRFAETGLDIQVTELDATIAKNTVMSDEVLEAQAKYYSDIMDAIVEYKDSVSAVVFWGTTDDMSWRAWGYPLLFNEDYTAKPAFDAIIDGIEYTAPETTEPTETTEPSTQTPDPTEILYGDVDGDNDVDIIDVLRLNQYLLSLTKIDDAGQKNADVNNDGKLADDDAMNILKSLVKLVTLPIEE